MKPYGMIKRIGYFKGKTDCHPKKGWVNWWEDFDTIVPRATMKLMLKREVANL